MTVKSSVPALMRREQGFMVPRRSPARSWIAQKGAVDFQRAANLHVPRHLEDLPARGIALLRFRSDPPRVLQIDQLHSSRPGLRPKRYSWSSGTPARLSSPEQVRTTSSRELRRFRAVQIPIPFPASSPTRPFEIDPTGAKALRLNVCNPSLPSTLAKRISLNR
jgi:hypothetical protein